MQLQQRQLMKCLHISMWRPSVPPELYHHYCETRPWSINPPPSPPSWRHSWTRVPDAWTSLKSKKLSHKAVLGNGSLARSSLCCLRSLKSHRLSQPHSAQHKSARTLRNEAIVSETEEDKMCDRLLPHTIFKTWQISPFSYFLCG